MKKILSNSIVILLIAVVVGLFTGRLVGEEGIRTILSIKQITGQIIFFLVPLIVIGFVAPSITALRQGATRLIFFAFLLAYVSSVGAATFAALVGYQTIPLLNIRPAEEGLRQLPELIFRVDIPPVMSVMSALLLAVFLGFGALRTSAVDVTRLLQQFRDIVLLLVRRVLMPVLPVYIAANFAALSYEGDVARLGIFLPVLACSTALPRPTPGRTAGTSSAITARLTSRPGAPCRPQPPSASRSTASAAAPSSAVR